MSAPQPWPALVLAAGLGTRLGPLSGLRAKAALPVAGRPLIQRILSRLADAGIRCVVINLHHRADTITRVVGDGSALGLDVRYSWEPLVLGSAGGPARAVPLLAADRFFIVNGDTLSEVDYAALAVAHEQSGAAVTMAVAPADLSKYNALLTDDQGAFTSIAPRGTQSPAASAALAWHFIGVQAVNAAAFAGVDPGRAADSLREVYPRLRDSRPGSVRVHPAAGAFYDIGTPDDYLRTALRLADAEGGALDRGAGTEIAATACVERSILWDRVRVNEGAVVSNCVVTDDVVIDAGARYDRVVITTSGVTPL